MEKRILSDSEKAIVRLQQVGTDGVLRCFISGDVVTELDEIEFDHIHPYAKDGNTDVSNMRIVLKRLNRRKSDQTLYDVRDNIRLERLFDAKRNNIRLQDILGLKDITKVNTAVTRNGDAVDLHGGSQKLTFPMLWDDVLKTHYFYGQVPVAWLENDDQEGLQPRVIDYRRLIEIRDHLRTRPQLAPSIGRVVDGQLKLFDGQHKLAAQILNNRATADIKFYLPESTPAAAKALFDNLMITNLEAHSKLKQVPFYTSTLLDRLSVIYKEILEEFLSVSPVEEHTEQSFVRFLYLKKGYTPVVAKEMLRGGIRRAALDSSPLSQYAAQANRDPNYPVTVDLLDKTLFRSTLFLEPSNARFTSDDDYRNNETANFALVTGVIVEKSHIAEWVPNPKGKTLTDAELRARRVWHKGSVLTWAPYLKTILFFALQIQTNTERDRMLYRAPVSDKQLQLVSTCLDRLFRHPLWDEPSGEIDSLLAASKKQDDLFARKGLTEKYVLYG